MLTVGYLRLSTEEQGDTSALEQQARRLLDAGATRLYGDFDSRMENDRPGLERLIADIEAGGIGAVTITRFDRLTARASLYERFVDLIRSRDVNLIVLDGSIDTRSADGYSLGLVIVAMSQGEVLKTRERIRRGVEHRRKMEKTPGGRAPFGYRIGQNGRYEFNDTPIVCLLSTRETRSPADAVRELFADTLRYGSAGRALREMNDRYGIRRLSTQKTRTDRRHVFDTAGRSATDIAEEILNTNLHVNSATARSPLSITIHAFTVMCRNPVYAGDTRYGYVRDGKRTGQEQWTIVRDTHPAFLSREDFAELDRVLSRARQRRGYGARPDSPPTPLAGLLVCAVCGGRLAARSRQGKDRVYRYYACQAVYQNLCTHRKSIALAVAENAIREKIRDRQETIAREFAVPKALPPDPEIEKLQAQLVTLRSIDNPAVAHSIASIERQIADRRKGLEIDRQIAESTKSYLDAIESDDYWNSLSPDELHQVYRALVDRAIVRDGQVIEVVLRV